MACQQRTNRNHTDDPGLDWLLDASHHASTDSGRVERPTQNSEVEGLTSQTGSVPDANAIPSDGGDTSDADWDGETAAQRDSEAEGGSRTQLADAHVEPEASTAEMGSTSGSGSSETDGLVDYLPCEVERLVRSRCRTCHTHGVQSPYFDTWAQVSLQVPLMLNAVASDLMPPSPPRLSAQEKQTLSDWATGGRPSVRASSPPNCAQPTP